MPHFPFGINNDDFSLEGPISNTLPHIEYGSSSWCRIGALLAMYIKYGVSSMLSDLLAVPVH